VADAAQTDDAERAAVQVGARKLIELPALPVAGAQPALRFADAPRAASSSARAWSATLSLSTLGVLVASTPCRVNAARSKLL